MVWSFFAVVVVFGVLWVFCLFVGSYFVFWGGWVWLFFWSQFSADSDYHIAAQ